MSVKTPKFLFVGRATNQWPYHSSLLLNLVKSGVEMDAIYCPRWSVKGAVFIDNKQLELSNDGIKFRVAKILKEPRNSALYSFRELISACSFWCENDQPRFYFERWLAYSGKFGAMPTVLLWLISKSFSLKFLRVIERTWSQQNINNVKFKIDLAKYDCVFVQHQTMRFSLDNDVVLKAQMLGVPVVGINYSWDSLFNKGIIHSKPDRFYCWNDAQRNCLIERHKLDRDSIVVAGSVFLDRWSRPSKLDWSDRCRNLIIYGGSSQNIVEDETENVLAVEKIVNELNTTRSEKLKLVFRPHPATNAFYSQKVELRDLIKVSTIAGDGVNKDYFEEKLPNLLCIIGVNTSLFLDSITNRIPILSTILTPSLLGEKCNRESTSHFLQLLDYGLIELSDNPEKFKADIHQIINHREEWLQKYSKFAKSFGIVENASKKIKEDLLEFLSNSQRLKKTLSREGSE